MAYNAARILIVDSDPAITDLIARQALRPLGYDVTVAGEAAAAIEQASHAAPDLILANLSLPGLSGKDLLVALNSQGVKAPVIVIAEHGHTQDAIQAFRLGASDVLFWPAGEAEVVAAVERALAQTREPRARQALDLHLKDANEELQRKVRELSSILTIGKAVVSVADQRQLLDHILDGALQVSEADLAWLMLRDDTRKVFLLRAHRNLPEAWAKKLNAPLEDGISSLAARSGESLLMLGQPLQKLKVSELGKSAAAVPIKVKSEVIGLLIVVRKNEREFSRDAQSLLEALADYASISLVNARLFLALAQSAQSARSSERQHYAALESARVTIREQVQAAGDPLNLLLTEMPGVLNPEQRQALESIQTALQRMLRACEMTVPPADAPAKEKKTA